MMPLLLPASATPVWLICDQAQAKTRTNKVSFRPEVSRVSSPRACNASISLRTVILFETVPSLL